MLTSQQENTVPSFVLEKHADMKQHLMSIFNN